jgi:hypothetical protein
VSFAKRFIGAENLPTKLSAFVAAEVNPPLFAGEVAVLQAGVNLG